MITYSMLLIHMQCFCLGEPYIIYIFFHPSPEFSLSNRENFYLALVNDSHLDLATTTNGLTYPHAHHKCGSWFQVTK